MSNHNNEAAYASAEIASMMQESQDIFFDGIGVNGAWSLFAGREGNSQWPLTDGVISAINPRKELHIAVEFKRANEGIHGILTALGQSYAYLEKGYHASVMVIPCSYPSHNSPGEHIKRIIEATAPDVPIWIYTYSDPDLSVARPFHGKLTCLRNKTLSACNTIKREAPIVTGRVSTLWAHIREGMSHPDAFYRFCQSVKIISSLGERNEDYKFPKELINAVKKIDRDADVISFLSSTTSDSILDKAWRRVWFNYYFWPELIPIFNSVQPYGVNCTNTRIRIDNNVYQGLFSGRSNSIKDKIVERLNSGTISEEEAWKEYAQKVRSDAHSYREVIDSGLYHIGFLSPNGDLTELGYRFVDACERNDSPYDFLPLEILRAALLQNGQFAALLHYIFKLSEERFDEDLFSFTTVDKKGVRQFRHIDYLDWLMDHFTNDLHVVQKVSSRGGKKRRSLQAEIGYMRKLGLVRSNAQGHAAFRIGTGLCIDWPQVETSIQFFNAL